MSRLASFLGNINGVNTVAETKQLGVPIVVGRQALVRDGSSPDCQCDCRCDCQCQCQCDCVDEGEALHRDPELAARRVELNDRYSAFIELRRGADPEQVASKYEMPVAQLQGWSKDFEDRGLGALKLRS